MASGFSGRTNPSSKAFDFAASDDVLCSYDDFSHESTNGAVSDPAAGLDLSSKDFQKSRMIRTYVPAPAYNKPDESLYQETFNMVEKCMKRHTDDLMQFLEGISSRLSQLEMYCYNVDKSVREMRFDLGRDCIETGSKLKSLEKHLGEVSRSVQILRDKQELAETQKELAKLQLAQKELSSPNAPQDSIEQSPSPTSDHYQTDDLAEAQNKQLALVVHHQVAPQQITQMTRPVEVPRPVPPPSQVTPQHMTQPQHYFLTSAPFQVQVQTSQSQYLTTDPQYQNSQQQDINLVRLQPTTQVTQALPQVHHFIQYQQRPQQPQQIQPSAHLSLQQPQLPQQVQPSAHQSVQQPPTPVQSRTQTAPVYPPRQPSQFMNQAPQEAPPSGIHMQHPYSSMPQQGMSQADGLSYGYSGTPVQQQPPPQQVKSNFGASSGDSYASVRPYQSFSPATAYMMFGNVEERRQSPPQQSQFQQGSYPPATVTLPQPQHVSMNGNASQPQIIRTHPYNDLIEKLVSMGFRSDRVLTMIQRMNEGGQAVDFNALLDRLNAESSAIQKGWTG